MWAASTLWIHYFSHPIAVRVKEPPSRRYTGPLATARYRKLDQRNGLGSGDGHKQPIMIKIDEEWRTVRMEELERVTRICAEILNVKRPTLHLRSLEDGCVELHYLVPQFVADAIFPLPLVQEAALAEAEVIRLSTKYYTFSLDEYLQFCKLKGITYRKESTAYRTTGRCPSCKVVCKGQARRNDPSNTTALTYINKL